MIKNLINSKHSISDTIQCYGEKKRQGKRDRKCRAGAAILLIYWWSESHIVWFHLSRDLSREGSVGISHRDREGERIQVRGKPKEFTFLKFKLFSI